jgi:23S rRNA (guanine745-N1)-methyltransferase
VCRSALYKDERSYFCTGIKKHCYDISAQGHTNLCPGKSTGGDDKCAVRSKTEFLNLGHYKPISDKVCEILSELDENNTVIDAGCGEGYYTNNIALKTNAHTYGFDLSKEAIISASKSAKRQGLQNARFFVGGIYNLPVCDESADAITNIFAPCAEGEFSRILKNGGRLVIVAAGENHLYGLKASIYDEVHTNDERADLPQNMKLEAEYNLSFKIFLGTPEEIRSLFSMTPYSYRTSEKDMQKLYALTSLETEVEVNIYVYRKEFS